MTFECQDAKIARENRAARSLADTKSALVDGAAITGVGSTDPAAGPEQIFADIGVPLVRTAGYGGEKAIVGVSQSQFGGRTDRRARSLHQARL